MDFYERVCGARLHAAYFRPGGVHQDLPAGCSTISRPGRAVPAVLDDIEDLLTENRIFKQRGVDIGAVCAKDAIDWGFTGVMLRSAGIPWSSCARPSPMTATSSTTLTSRWARPATATSATSAAWRRCASPRRSSCRGWSGCPTDRCDGRHEGGTPPRRDETGDGGPDSPLQTLHRGLSRAGRRTYAAVEAPKGEFGVYLVSDRANKPYRCKCARPALPTCLALRKWPAATCWPTPWR